MNYARNVVALLLSILVLLTAGCQSTVNVRVERVLINPKPYLRANSVLGRELELTRRNLENYVAGSKRIGTNPKLQLVVQ